MIIFALNITKNCTLQTNHMNYIACSSCSAILVNSQNYYCHRSNHHGYHSIYFGSIVSASCHNCYINGNYKLTIMAKFNLGELTRIKALESELLQYKAKYTSQCNSFSALKSQMGQYKAKYAIELNNLKKLESEFQQYKIVSFLQNNLLLRTLINENTYEVIKKFDQFKNKIQKVEDKKLSKQVDDIISRLFKTTEIFIEKQITKETKYLTRLFEVQSLSAKKSKLQVEDIREDLRAKLLCSSAWQAIEIDLQMDLFDRKIRILDGKKQIRDDLIQQGQKITNQMNINENKQYSLLNSQIMTGQRIIN